MKKLLGVLLTVAVLLNCILLPAYAENVENKDDTRLDLGEIFGYSYKISFVDGENVTKKEFLENNTIIYPELTASREYDAVWSLSENEYVAPPVTMPKEEVTVYAFKNPVISFENYPSVPYAQDSASVSVSSDYAFSGKKSFKYQNVHSSNSRENSLALGKATIGTSYKIKFKYYVSETLKTDHTITPYTGYSNLWAEGNVDSGKREDYTVSNFNISANTATKVWLDGEIYFTTSPYTFGGYDDIYLAFSSTSVNLGDSIYFDDFAIEEMVTADFIIPDGFKFNGTKGTLSGNTFTAYYEKTAVLSAPEVLTNEGIPVVWLDEDGAETTIFVANGIYRVKLNSKGDLNADGAVTTLDLSLMKLYLVEIINEDEINAINGDIDSNGKVNITDIAYLKLHLAGIIDKL